MQTLFNQPQSARAAVQWQPHAGIAKKLSDRGYATTSWTNDVPQDFADLSYPAKASGFSAAHYQPMRQPLSQQAQASLALLENEYRNESFGEEKPESQAGTETNEHLPFVMDDFGATRKSKLRVNVDPKTLKRALAQAELAEGLVVSPITSDDQRPELIVIHPDEATPVVEEQPTEATPVVAVAEEEVAPVPQEPAVVGGIPPEEVAEREAAQFAKGLAQAREEAAVELAAAVEKAMAEGLEKGLAQGRLFGKAEGLAEGLDQGTLEGVEKGKEQGLAEGLEQGLQQGLDQGKELGEQTARQALAEEMAMQRVVFENVSRELSALMAEPKKFFEPLNRLATHLAEQLVLGELQTSSKAIERLVQRCLDELDHPVHGAVVLELNTEDKELLQKQGGDFTKGMRLEAVHDMQRGSVRVFANDTVVEDLVSHRLETLVKALQLDEDAWRDKSPLLAAHVEVQEKIQEIVQPVVQEEVEDGDVHS